MRQLLLLGILGLEGCLPFITPPTRLSVGAGPATGNVSRSSGKLEPRSVTTVRMGFHPLQLMPGASKRAFDAGIGYEGDLIFGRAPEHHDQRTSAHGPYLEAGFYPLRVPLSSATTFRWGGRATADLLYLEPKNEVGYGGSLATEIEFSGDAKGPFADADEESVVVGAGIGQWAIGAFAGGSARYFEHARYGDLVFGLSARIPLSFGVICCVWSSSHQESHPSAPAPSHKHSHPTPAPKSEPPKSEPPERVPAKLLRLDGH